MVQMLPGLQGLISLNLLYNCEILFQKELEFLVCAPFVLDWGLILL